MQQSTTVQPARPSISSRSSHRLMWFSWNGSAMRSHFTAGREAAALAGGDHHGFALAGHGVGERVIQQLFESVHGQAGRGGQVIDVYVNVICNRAL